nr:hypothetical protein [Tanacetum cinerariifolium]
MTRGLASVEEQLVFYKKNEVLFYEQIAVLKRDISYKDSEISVLKSELEKLKQEKESNQLKIKKFDIASKSLDKLIGSQIPDNNKKGLGYKSYHAIPPPPTGLFSPPKLGLSNFGLEEFQQHELKSYRPKTSKSVSENIFNEVKESPDAPLVKELVLNDKLEKKTVFTTVAKKEFVRPKQQEKLVRKPVKPRPVNTARPNSTVVNAVRVNQIQVSDGLGPQRKLISLFYVLGTCPISLTSKNLMKDMLPLGEEPKEEELLIKGRLKVYFQIKWLKTGKLTTAIDVNAVEAKVKTINGEEQIQALVDKKKVIITETSVRSDLHLEDAEGTECLPTATIFEKLTLMSSKTTAWNEFSSTMVSAIICLTTNQKFNFSKYIFDHMVKNLEGGVKFLMFPRFMQVFLDSQVERMLKHKEIYVTPSHTKKIFGNIKRRGKDFSSKVTPLFETMMVQPQEDIGEDSEIPTKSIPQSLSATQNIYFEAPTMETMGYHFYNVYENKFSVAHHAELFEDSLKCTRSE